MKTRSLSFMVVIWFLFLGGVVQAQQEKGREDRPSTGQSPPGYDSFMGGKEHYLADSPFYMAGKRHYRQSDSSSISGKNEQGDEKNPGPKDEKTADLAEKPEEEGRISPPPSQPCPDCSTVTIYFTPQEGAAGMKY